MASDMVSVRTMIAAHGWDAETALALVLEYLRHEAATAHVLDLLIEDLARNGKVAGLFSFLQDCVMTGTDQDIARSVKVSTTRTTSRGFKAPVPEKL
jgi:hypothetical protein